MRAGRVIALALVLGLGALAVLWLGYRGVRWIAHAALTGNPHFTVRRYDLQADGRLTPRLIHEYAGLPDLQEEPNLFTLDLASIHRELERVPRVREVVVVRHLPDMLSVRVVERTALAQVRVRLADRPVDMLVDPEGHVLGPRMGASALPMIGGLRQDGLGTGGLLTDPAAHDALALLALCDRTLLGQVVRVRHVDVGGAEAMELVLEGGERVRMPRADLERKLRELASILVTIEDMRLAEDRARVHIDMTTEERFPVRGLRTPAGARAARGLDRARDGRVPVGVLAAASREE